MYILLYEIQELTPAAGRGWRFAVALKTPDILSAAERQNITRFFENA
jgi:hypothetical protein